MLREHLLAPTSLIQPACNLQMPFSGFLGHKECHNEDVLDGESSVRHSFLPSSFFVTPLYHRSVYSKQPMNFHLGIARAKRRPVLYLLKCRAEPPEL
jgi:hypothetical protein